MNKINLGKGIVIFLVNGTIALTNIPKVSAESYLVPQKNILTTTDSVNMRFGNSKETERVGKIAGNEEVEVLISYDEEWDLVRYKNTVGFVKREFLNGIVDPNFDSNITLCGGYVTALEDVRLRTGESTDYEKIGTLLGGEEAEVIGITDNNWFIVRNDDKIGYVSGEYVHYSQEKGQALVTEENIVTQPTVTDLYIYPTSNLNFRESPDKEGKKISLIDKGTPLKLLDFLNTGWFQVEYNGQIGYVSADYISFNNGENYRNDIQKVIYAKSRLNLRSMPNTDSEIYYTLSRYETAEVLRTEGDWYLVRVDNRLGYVNREYTETLSGKFVVVDISAQTLTLYDGNRIVLETPVVTGDKDKYDTPTGKFEIRKKDTDTYLVGPGYRTHVDYWMPFNGGIGLHDADWRSKFGGNIYVNNGSHGCVNIPPKYADDVFENVKKGTKVLVQK